MKSDYEIVRGQFLDRSYLPYLTLYNDTLSFNNRCVELLCDCEYVNIIPQKDGEVIRIRGCQSYDFDAVKWYNVKKGQKKARKIRSRILTAMLFNKLGFDYGHKYKLVGEYRNSDVDELLFYSANPQVYVLNEENGMRRFLEKYPETWKDSFGIPESKRKSHNLVTFEDYAVLDVTLEKVNRREGTAKSEEEIKKMRELKEKYIKG